MIDVYGPNTVQVWEPPARPDPNNERDMKDLVVRRDDFLKDCLRDNRNRTWGQKPTKKTLNRSYLGRYWDLSELMLPGARLDVVSLLAASARPDPNNERDTGDLVLRRDDFRMDDRWATTGHIRDPILGT